MESKDYLKDISEIKELMNRSSRFISLSGLSGVLAGIYALIGAAIAYGLYAGSYDGYEDINGHTFRVCALILLTVAALSILTSIWLSTRNARKSGVTKIWDATSRRLVVNFLIPLLAGGLYILITFSLQNYGLTASLMLIFYGLALVNASKYSLGDIWYLGIIEIVLGLTCALLPNYGFWFWVLGFGIMHIVYGSLMYFKYERGK